MSVVTKNANKIILHLKEKFGLNNSSKVLDFGCGNGEFIEECGENCYGIELAHKNHSRIVSSLDKIPKDIKFDFIIMLGVLEHLNEIYKTFQLVTQKLKKDGYIIITTVDAESNIPYQYKPPEHLTYWTQKSFIRFSKNIDLKIVEYEKYEMFQKKEIYLERILSRTPKKLAETIYKDSIDNLPEYVLIPTNEIFVILKNE